MTSVSKKRIEAVLICMLAPKAGEPLMLADNVLDTGQAAVNELPFGVEGGTRD